MSIRRKQLIVFWLIAGLFAWPLVHHALVERYDLDKWSFLGFSMYISKRPIYVYDENVPRSLHLDWSRVRQDQYPAINQNVIDFVRQRRTYGQWYDSSRFAQDMFETLEQIDEFAFDFDVLEMNDETAIFEGVRYRYAAQRRGSDGQLRFVEKGQPIPHEEAESQIEASR